LLASYILPGGHQTGNKVDKDNQDENFIPMDHGDPPPDDPDQNDEVD
jgi:hypothetical protein